MVIEATRLWKNGQRLRLRPVRWVRALSESYPVTALRAFQTPQIKETLTTPCFSSCRPHQIGGDEARSSVYLETCRHRAWVCSLLLLLIYLFTCSLSIATLTSNTIGIHRLLVPFPLYYYLSLPPTIVSCYFRLLNYRIRGRLVRQSVDWQLFHLLRARLQARQSARRALGAPLIFIVAGAYCFAI